MIVAKIYRRVCKRLMNILVIGNGFDLAHGLPTRYGDFWSYINQHKKILLELMVRLLVSGTQNL